MPAVNSICAEISIYQGVGERTGVTVERNALRGRKGLCKSMRDLSMKARILGDGYYYLPLELWPDEEEPVEIHNKEWTAMSSLKRTRRRRRTSRPDEDDS